eukprot:GGOE01018704.1.p1 GENE.GGOE01018704.1~~GGOE01018704.1.p1  ORF type:complete len:203 (-),score=59.68 GGOE01018704.1:677-1285(-)
MGSEALGTFRLLVTGDCNVGKTSLVSSLANSLSSDRRTTSSSFNEHAEITLGTELHVCTMTVNGTPTKLQVYVLPGQDRFTADMPYYSKADGALIMYDITALDSFQHVAYWLRKLPVNTPTVLVGNKADLQEEREVAREAAAQLAERHQLPFIEASAKTRHNVEEAFQLLCRALYRHTRAKTPLTSPSPLLDYEASCCCAIL